MGRKVRIGKLVLDGKPRVAVVVDREMALRTLMSLRGKGVDLLEVRADLFSIGTQRLVGFVQRLRTQIQLPLICTVRETARNRTTRLEIFRQLLPLVDAVDIEVDTDIRDKVVSMAEGKTVIVSYHDFRRMPDHARLQSITREALNAGADIVKIAGMARCSDDVARLMLFCHASSCPMVAIAMGPYGTISRVVGPLFGSLFSYAFINRAVAPGQIPLSSLVEDFRRFYPVRTLGTSE